MPSVFEQYQRAVAATSSKRMPPLASKCPVLPRAARSKMENEPNEPQAHLLLPRQLTAIQMLFEGASGAQVCKRLSIHRKTLYRWRHSDAFKQEIDRRYRETKVSQPIASPPHDEPLWMRELRKSPAEAVASAIRNAG